RGGRDGALEYVSVAVERMPQKVRKDGSMVVKILVRNVDLFMIFKGYKMSSTTWNRFVGELPFLRVGISYLPLPLGGLVTLVFVLERLLLGDQSPRAVMHFDVVAERVGAA
ncbi:TRAP transporter small permease, partial [Pseudomonas syringae]